MTSHEAADIIARVRLKGALFRRALVEAAAEGPLLLVWVALDGDVESAIQLHIKPDALAKMDEAELVRQVRGKLGQLARQELVDSFELGAPDAVPDLPPGVRLN